MLARPGKSASDFSPAHPSPRGRGGEMPRRARPPGPRALGLRGLPPPAHRTPPPTAPSSRVGSCGGSRRLTGRRNSRCSCAMSSRYLFREHGSAIAAASGAHAQPRAVFPLLPSSPPESFPLDRSLEGRKRKLGEAGAVPGILPRELEPAAPGGAVRWRSARGRSRGRARCVRSWSR